MSIEPPTDKERQLTERNERLAGLLREARDQMVTVKDAVDDFTRWQAISGALDYAILATDMRITECKVAVARGVVGQEADRARPLDGFAIEAIFETALRASGFEVVPITGAAS